MSDPRREVLATGTLSLTPSAAFERWELRSPDAGSPEGAPAAPWGEWVRMAKRILDADARSRELEAQGDAWDTGYAAGSGNRPDAVNPFR